MALPQGKFGARAFELDVTHYRARGKGCDRGVRKPERLPGPAPSGGWVNVSHRARGDEARKGKP